MRKKLPQRRESDTFDFRYQGNRYHISYTVVNGEIKEIFAHGAKVGSDTDASLATVTAFISIALQHGVPYDELEHAALKLDDGSQAELYGEILKRVRAEVRPDGK